VSSQVTIWGTPGAAVHDKSRGWGCVGGGSDARGGGEEICAALGESEAPPFLTLPSACAGPLESTGEGDSWPTGNPLSSASFEKPATTFMAGLNGCSDLSTLFGPSIEVKPERTTASTPTGMNVDLHVPQEASMNAQGLAVPAVKDIEVTLPEGVTVNPSGANGLQACSEASVGFEAGSSTTESKLFGPEEAACPEAAKIGNVTIKTPLLADPLKGSVYLAAQSENPFGSLIAMYIVAKDPESGVLVKLPGEVRLNPATGQITTTFANDPQLPFEDAELELYGGQSAPLAISARCGTYETKASLTPWSGGEPVKASSSFTVSGPCPARQPFAPSFTAGTTSNQAGGFSPFTLSFARQDGEQDLKSIEQTLPPGLLARLAGVPLCGEPLAAQGACPEASRIGGVTVGAGVGSDPVSVDGSIYLTGPYNGGPFGVVVEVPAIAGPFNLDEDGRPVVVRASIRINSSTAQASIVSDPFPTILQGIPLHVKTVSVTLDRPGFTFNPTSCDPLSITATIGSSEGANAAVASPFEAANCAPLPFKPSFTATTQGQASKADGASLLVKVSSKGGPGTAGEEANIRSVKVDLPKQLPSRLTTLQKACTKAQFNSNPAGCPKESDVGTATVETPVLASALTGPAYLVSHGGEAFPDLEIVLQGEGVTLVLDGNTPIRNGITSSTFKTVPDAPIASFELKLPQGKYSVFGTDLPESAKYSLCGQTLNMPTAITGQNGVEIHETTKIAISDCPKANKASKKKAHKKNKKARK
jgi:hypothetical protein